jgi:O-antigen biosynthesis protein
MESNCDISIIIVSYNCLESLRDCLKSIDDQKGIRIETYVIDNDSHDGTPDYLKAQKINSIFPGRNLGFGAGINLGASKATGKYFLILNPDTILTSESLTAFLAFAESHPDFGLASAHLLYTDGRTQISARKLPRRRDFLLGRASPVYKLGLSSEKDAGYLSLTGETPLEVPAVSATALFVRSDLFRELGGFDERFFMYLEDLDLCKRVSDRCLSNWILPQAKVIHAWRKSSSTRPFSTAWHHYLSVYKYFKKHYPSQWCKNFSLTVALAAGFAINFALIAVRERVKN